MVLVDKVRRKCFTKWYSWALPVLPRRRLSSTQLLDEISSDTTQTNFLKSPVLFTYDDFCFQDGTRGTLDHGGNLDGNVNKYFEKWCAYAELVKHTFFFIPDPRHLGHGDFSKFLKSPHFAVNNPNLYKQSEYVYSLIEKSKVEIALHGLHHVRQHPRDYFSAYEFDFRSREEIRAAIEQGIKLTQAFSVCGYKPPAWSCGQLTGNLKLVDELQAVDYFDYVSLSSPTNGLNYARQTVSHLYPTSVGLLFNIPQNVSILWSIGEIKSVIDLIIRKRGIVNIQMHFVESTLSLADGWSEKNLKKLQLIYDWLRKDHSDDVEFCYSKEVKELWQNPISR